MRIWIKNPLAVFQPGEAVAASGDTSTAMSGGIVVEDGWIAEHISAGSQPEARVDDVLDASDAVLLPGLINTHHHFYQTLTRALPQALNLPLFDWLKSLYPVWAGLTPDSIRYSTQLAGAELLLSGCTTSVDHHYVFPKGLEDAIDLQAEAAADMGLRVVLTRGSMSLGEDAGGLPPERVVQDVESILLDSERLAQHLHHPESGAMCQIALAPCSPFSVTPELLKETAALAERYELRLHTHLAETEDENAFCEQAFGKRPLAHMADCGWLSDRVWFAHGIHFTAEEIEQLGRAGCGVSHCPSSNMFLASGLCPVPRLVEAGVAVSLAVDGSASNDASNMIVEARQALLLQRLGHGAQVSAEDALSWATLGGARVLNRPELGSLAVGSAADLALFRLQDCQFSGTHDPVAALLFAGAHRADHVMVNGEWRVRDKELLGMDLASLQAAHRAEAARLVADL